MKSFKEFFEENFKDGKKKGKSRPGRAKRAGVNCKKSKTELRKIAKNSSGEKQKMAHFCANMKKSDEEAPSEDEQRLDDKCWDGYKKQGTKMKGGKRVNNCVKK
jgi:hypothetical protein